MLTSFLFAVFNLHNTAGPVLTCSNYTITYSHVHGGTCVSIMRVKETGTVFVFFNQLQIQKVLKHMVITMCECATATVGLHIHDNVDSLLPFIDSD